MPAQDRARRDQPELTQRLGQQADQRGDHRSIRPIQARPRISSAQHSDLATQDKQLDIPGRRRATEQHQPTEQPDKDQIEQAQRHDSRSCRPRQSTPVTAGRTCTPTSETPQASARAIYRCRGQGRRGFDRRGLLEDLVAAPGCSVVDLTGQPFLPPDQPSAEALAALRDIREIITNETRLAIFDGTGPTRLKTRHSAGVTDGGRHGLPCTGPQRSPVQGGGPVRRR
jgi:hypothetical protein